MPATPRSATEATPDRGGNSGYTSIPPFVGRYQDQPVSERIAESRLIRTTVRRLKRCLSALPGRVLLVLELRSGVAASHTLSVAQVADYLNISRQRIVRLERRGLRLLLRRSRSHDCGAAMDGMGMSAPVYSSAAPHVAVPIAEEQAAAASGSVKGFHSAHAPLGVRGAEQDKLLAGARPAADNPIVVVLAVLAGMLLLALVTADALGIGPRHPQWRRRWLRRLRGR